MNIDEILRKLQSTTEKRVCRTLWETFDKFLALTRKDPMDMFDNAKEDALIELQERLEEVLPYSSKEVTDEPRRGN